VKPLNGDTLVVALSGIDEIMKTKILNVEPIAKKAIDEARKEGAVIVMMVDGFQTESEALYLRDMLWYARNNGVVVNFVPEEDTTDYEQENYHFIT
jgi:hypothetical protein